jgi:hypothetical protein
MSTPVIDAEEIAHEARLDERDETVAYLRMVARHMLLGAVQHPWYKRWTIRSGAAAVLMVAEHVSQRHRKRGI